jgi:hypothetical protein
LCNFNFSSKINILYILVFGFERREESGQISDDERKKHWMALISSTKKANLGVNEFNLIKEIPLRWFAFIKRSVYW